MLICREKYQNKNGKIPDQLMTNILTISINKKINSPKS